MGKLKNLCVKIAVQVVTGVQLLPRCPFQFANHVLLVNFQRQLERIVLVQLCIPVIHLKLIAWIVQLDFRWKMLLAKPTAFRVRQENVNTSRDQLRVLTVKRVVPQLTMN